MTPEAAQLESVVDWRVVGGAAVASPRASAQAADRAVALARVVARRHGLGGDSGTPSAWAAAARARRVEENEAREARRGRRGERGEAMEARRWERGDGSDARAGEDGQKRRFPARAQG